MFLRLISIISPIFICAAVGYVWARAGRPFDTAFVSRLIMAVGAPCLIVSSLSKAGVERGALGSLGLAVVCLLAVTGLIGVMALRVLRMEIRSYLGSMLFPNTGNMGLPLCLFAFGQDGLSLGLVVFVIVSLAHFTGGLALVSGEGHPLKLLGNPIVWSAAVGAVLMLTGWNLPAWLAHSVDIMAGLAIPLMLLALGVSLARLKVRHFSRSLFLATMRIGVGFAVGLGLARAFGLEGVTRGVLVLDASMPVAVFNYLLAERYARAPDEIAGAVVVSTVLSFFALPLILWYLLGS